MPTELQLKEGWASLLFLVLLVLCVAWCMQAAEWAGGMYILPWVVLLAGLLGTVLAKSHLPTPAAHLLSALVGFTWVSWLTSRVLITTMQLPGVAAVADLDWRIRVWLWDLFAQGKSSVGAVFLPVLGLLLWLMAHFAAWAVFRWRRVWLAVIVCGVAILINVTAVGRNKNLTWFLVVFLLLALLLVVRSNLASYEQRWRKEQVHYGSEVISGFLRAGLLVSIVAIGLAWVVPRTVGAGRLEQAWNRMSQPWRRLQDAWYDWFQDLNYNNQPQYILISRSMTFGGPVVLTDTPVMAVQAPNGRYWRTRVFQEYVGFGWDNTDADSLVLVADDPRLSAQPTYGSRGLITQTITLQQDLGLGGALTAAGQPMKVSIPVEALTSHLTRTLDTIEPPLEALEGRQTTGPSWIYPRHGLAAGQAYRVVSSVSAATGQQLLQAGTDYPAWVVPRYLQLPKTLPDRIRRLAEEITVGQATPYEKVIAVEKYLRTFTYDTEIPGPGSGQDGVDYFLFQERQGYCTYYASAMVVMLRAVGVPARYVEGYSQDLRQQGVYQIRELDSHAWPEVFFPGYGWVEFEPTASKPLNSYSSLQDASSSASTAGSDRQTPDHFEEDDSLLPELGPGSRLGQHQISLWQRLGPWIWVGLALVIVGMATAGLLVVRRRRQMAGLSAAERVYRDLVGWVARLMHIRLLPHQTPHEFAGVVGEAVPQGRNAIEHIADLYGQERFGGRTILGADAEAAWREARPSLWRRWLQRQVDHPLRAMRRLLVSGRKPPEETEPIRGA